MQWPVAVCRDAVEVSLELPGERFQRLDTAAYGPRVPCSPCPLGPPLGAIAPQVFEVILEDADGHELAIGFEKFIESRALLAVHRPEGLPLYDERA